MNDKKVTTVHLKKGYKPLTAPQVTNEGHPGPKASAAPIPPSGGSSVKPKPKD